MSCLSSPSPFPAPWKMRISGPQHVPLHVVGMRTVGSNASQLPAFVGGFRN